MQFETSQIAAILSLSNFFIHNFSHSSWYPYWYLGNPFHFLIGPVVPVELLVLSYALPLDLYILYFLLILGSLIVGSLGIYLLLRDWGVKRRESLLSATFYMVFPASYLLLYYQNGLKHTGIALLPFTVFFY